MGRMIGVARIPSPVGPLVLLAATRACACCTSATIRKSCASGCRRGIRPKSLSKTPTRRGCQRARRLLRRRPGGPRSHRRRAQRHALPEARLGSASPGSRWPHGFVCGARANHRSPRMPSVPSAPRTARNPVAVIVPCHRIIGSNGTLTGYGGGLERKRWLLEHEGCRLTFF